MSQLCIKLGEKMWRPRGERHNRLQSQEIQSQGNCVFWRVS